MSRDTHFRTRKLAPLILATSWCASAALPVYAGKPVDKSELPAAAVPGELPAASSLIAAADTEQVLPPPVEPKPEVAVSTPPASSRPSQDLTINLINRMVTRGLLPKEDADELIKQAEADSAEARSAAVAEEEARIQAAVAQALAAAQPTPPPPAEDAVRVTYIPEVVKAQLRDEIKQDVITNAKEQNWVAPKLIPEWASRIKLFGDIRVRGEGIFFADGNDNTGAFPNFNAINTGAPFDVSGTVFSPQLNVDQDRYRLRLRARLGLEADLGNGFSAGLRIATGENNSPVSTNQSLGAAGNGQGGNFSKYAIWLDRGFLRYEVGGVPEKNLAITVGRFDNPFFSTEIIWDDDIGFDGIAIEGRYQVLPGITPFFAGGAFPVFNTDFNFASNRPSKFESDDKWLYAAQIGVDWRINEKIDVKLAAAYYDFRDVEGKLSDPFVPLTPEDAGNTDSSRPSFAQKGNTYRPIRNIIPTADNDFGTSRQFQYFGLATPFRNLALTGRVDLNHFEPFQISFVAEYIKNLAFKSGDIDAIAVNNRGPNDSFGSIGKFEGGDTAWIVGARVGKLAFEKRWDWNVGFNYRYVESDAVIDGFNDSDFGGGGTNLKGFSLFGSIALSPRTSFGMRWMSAEEIAGPPLKVDTFQIEFNGRF